MNDEPLDKRKTRLKTIDLQQGLQVGSFELDCRLGEGSTGVVWRGIDPYRAYKHNPGYVALKFLAQSAREDSVEITRAIDTFKVVHLLQHPHICPCYSLWEDHRFGNILAMRYVDGVSLHQYGQSLQGNGQAVTDEVLRVLRCVAAALDYAHQPQEFHSGIDGVIHRDIKPSNILVSRDGREVQLVDFGIAVTVGNTANDGSGTFDYMSPEQWLSNPLSPHSDQYSLAVVAFEMLTGRLPFCAHAGSALKVAVLHATIPYEPSLSAAVNAAFARGLAKNPNDRFDTCVRLIDALVGEAPAHIAPSALVQRETRKILDLCGEFLENHDCLQLVKNHPDALIVQAEMEGLFAISRQTAMDVTQLIGDGKSNTVIQTRLGADRLLETQRVIQQLVERGYDVEIISSDASYLEAVQGEQSQPSSLDETGEPQPRGNLERKNDMQNTDWSPASLVGRARHPEKMRVMIDTCSLMTPDTREFLQETFLPWALAVKKQHAIQVMLVPKEVIRELETLSQKGDTRQQKQASAGIVALHKMLEAEILAPFELSYSGDLQSADDVFIAVMLQLLLKFDVLLMTQDKALALTCTETYNLRQNSQAQTGSKGRRFAACRVFRNHKENILRLAKHKFDGEPRPTPSRPTPSRPTPSRPTGAARTKPAVRELSQELVLAIPIPSNPGDVIKGINATYHLNQRITGGGEGTVYEIQNSRDLVAKIYHPQELKFWRFEKLKLMVENPVHNKGVAWPSEIVSNSEGQPVGFLMPRVENALPIV
ncbi:MAG: protein kinase, partial [Candidatus Melainabacteria bacterium]|nr:protein kinase [Candidatus Melainabacteria bacterium]